MEVHRGIIGVQEEGVLNSNQINLMSDSFYTSIILTYSHFNLEKRRKLPSLMITGFIFLLGLHKPQYNNL